MGLLFRLSGLGWLAGVAGWADWLSWLAGLAGLAFLVGLPGSGGSAGLACLAGWLAGWLGTFEVILDKEAAVRRKTEYESTPRLINEMTQAKVPRFALFHAAPPISQTTFKIENNRNTQSELFI